MFMCVGYTNIIILIINYRAVLLESCDFMNFTQLRMSLRGYIIYWVYMLIDYCTQQGTAGLTTCVHTVSGEAALDPLCPKVHS